MLSNKRVLLIFAIFVSIMFIGEGLIYIVDPYDYDADVIVTQDGVEYRIDSSISADYKVSVLEGGNKIDRIYAYYDECYTDLNMKRNQADFISILNDELGIRGFEGMSKADAEEIREVIVDDLVDPRSTAIFMCSGSFPELLYDGTVASPILEWLRAGGTLIWIGGPMGAFYSEGDDLVEVEPGYEALFFGQESSGVFRTDGSRLFIQGQGQVTTDIEDALGIVINDATYGINEKILEKTGVKYLPLGYLSDTGYRCAVLTEMSGSGMMALFGCELNQFYTEAIAQVVVSGLTSGSELVAYDHGSMKSGELRGRLAFDIGGDFTVLVSVENVKVVFSRAFSFNSVLFGL